MKLTATLSRYIAKNYALNMLFLLLGLLAIIYLFDTVELLRRANKRSDVPLGLVLQMGLLKLPEVGQLLLPFAVLFSAIYTFWQLTRRHELVVVRASGFSVWQFLAPVIGIAFLVGILQITIMSPVGALFLGKFEQMERTYLSRQDSQIAIFKEGLWLRQGVEDTGGYAVMHAAKIDMPVWNLRRVMVLNFDADNKFIRRLDADSATLEGGLWVFSDVKIYNPGRQSQTVKEYNMPTRLTRRDIEESFSSPETMSFWNLPGHIRTLEATGFDATSLRIHYQSLLSQPLMLIAMVLLAATVSTRPPRLGGAFPLIAVGIFVGFVVFFISSFMQALGSSGQMPIMLAAWSPALICFLLGLSVIVNIEDG